MKISVFIINFNNAPLLRRSICSIINQDYKNNEIICYDDFSNDNSKKIIKKFPRIKKIFLKKKYFYGAHGQIFGIKKCLKICKGEIICFLDSDDFYHKNKLRQVYNFFKKNKKQNIVSDMPIDYYNKSKQKKNYYNYNSKRIFRWPKFAPQSCISVRKSFLEKNINLLSVKKFDHIWFDFRIMILEFLISGNIGKIEKHLTFYHQSSSTISSKYNKFNKNWWLRRMEAFDFIDFIIKKNKNYKNFFYFDKMITTIVNKLINFIK